MPEGGICKRRFEGAHQVGGHTGPCRRAHLRSAAERAAEAEAAGPADLTPPPAKRRLPFAFSASDASPVCFEENIVADPVCTTASNLMEASLATASIENNNGSTPEAEVTKEEVLHCLKRMLMGIADTSGVRKADNLIKLLRHKSLDLTWLRVSVDSIAQLRDEERDEAQRWLAALDFVEKTDRDPEDANCSGVARFRDPVSVLKRQISKAGAGEVRYDPFIERNRMGTRFTIMQWAATWPQHVCR
jgi:hypothetical protein